MKKLAGIAATAILGSALLTGCGGSDFCAEAEETFGDGSAIASIDPNDPDALQEAADQFNELADSAPDEIKDDFTLVGEQFELIAEADGDVTALAEIDTTGLTEAGQNIQTWGEENC